MKYKRKHLNWSGATFGWYVYYKYREIGIIAYSPNELFIANGEVRETFVQAVDKVWNDFLELKNLSLSEFTKQQPHHKPS